MARDWRTRTNSREAANYTFAVHTAQLSVQRSALEFAEQIQFAGLARAAENNRNLVNQVQLAGLEVALATSAKLYAIDVAAAEKDNRLARLADEGPKSLEPNYYYGFFGGPTGGGLYYENQSSQPWKDRRADLANALSRSERRRTDSPTKHKTEAPAKQSTWRGIAAHSSLRIPPFGIRQVFLPKALGESASRLVFLQAPLRLALRPISRSRTHSSRLAPRGVRETWRLELHG